MNTDYYKYLLTVADCRSIHQAAELLHMKQQNLSTIIKNVEQYYGITIFERLHKGVLPTADGAFFLQEAKALLNIANRMESLYLYPSKRYYSGIVDNITFYCTNIISSHSLISMLEEFRKHFPYVNVNLLTRSRNNILQTQPNEPKSISLISIADGANHKLAEIPENILVKPYPRTNVYAVTAKNNPAAQHLESISVDELLQKKLVILSQDPNDDTFVQDLLAPYGAPNIQYIVNNTTFFLDLLKHNDLWSVCIANRFPTDALLVLPFTENLRLQSYVLYHQDSQEDYLITSFLKLLDNMPLRC